MTVRFAMQTEIDNWDNLILSNHDGGNIFSSYEFAMQKETGGYKARFILIDELAITVLEKNAPLLGKLWYLPKGPEVDSIKQLLSVLKEIEPFAEKNDVFAIRIEPELDRNHQTTLKRHDLIKSKPIIPNPSTITLDISPKLETILTNLPQKGRYAIKRAQRDGVTIETVDSNEKNCQIMYELLSETAKGQFGIRSYDYYRTFWQRFESAGLGQLFFAYYDKLDLRKIPAPSDTLSPSIGHFSVVDDPTGSPPPEKMPFELALASSDRCEVLRKSSEIVAGAYAMTFGAKSTYKDGASIRSRSAYGASHLLQWHVIQWAKSHGSKTHDFCGSPPSDEINNPDHKHYGIGLFKTAFNKTVTDYVGCYDLVINPAKYKVWVKFGEKVAHRVHYYKHHDSYY